VLPCFDTMRALLAESEQKNADTIRNLAETIAENQIVANLTCSKTSFNRPDVRLIPADDFTSCPGLVKGCPHEG
jgi:hypothetical protein